MSDPTPTPQAAIARLRDGLPLNPGLDNERDALIRIVVGMSPEAIAAERANGWKHFHPEDYCHHCGAGNVPGGGWWADSDRWNLAVEGLERGRMEILCPSCFVALWEKATGLWASWHLVPENIRAAK